MSRALFALGASALALAGCGGSDSEVSVPSATPTVAQVTTASTISAAQGGAEGETTPAAVAALSEPAGSSTTMPVDEGYVWTCQRVIEPGAA